MAKQELGFLDIEELAAHLCGFAEEDDYDQADLDEKLMDKYALDLDHFTYLLKDLSPLLEMAVSPLTEEPFIGFGTSGVWLAKKPFKGFINQVLVWMDAENIQKGKSNGFERGITKEGKPEFKLILIKHDAEFSIKGADRKEVSNG